MTQAITNKKPPYLLMYIVTLVYLVVTAFFEEGVAYFDPVYTTLMSSTEFYLTFSLCAILFLTVVSIAKHYFGIKTNLVFFMLVALLFLIDVVAILSFPEWTVLTGVYHITASLRLRYITFWLAACMAFYVFFAIMPKSVPNTRNWNFYFFGAVFIALTSCVYSYIKEQTVYQHLLFGNFSFVDVDPPVSFTNNRNTYGTLLFVGLSSSVYLFAQTRRWWYPFISIFFFVNILVTFSRTAIFSSAIVIIISFVCFVAKSIKVHPVISSFLIILFLAFFLSPIVIFLISPSLKSGFFVNISNVIKSLFDFKTLGKLYSLQSRADIWADICIFISRSPVSLLFGIGDWNFSWFLGFDRAKNYSYIESAHSGFFDVLGRGGLFGLAFYSALIVYYFYCLLKNYRNKIPFTTINLSIFIGIIVHGLFEDTNFLNMQAKPMMFLFMAFMPVISNYRFSVSGKNEMWEEEYCQGHSASNRNGVIVLSKLEIAFAILTPLNAAMIGLSLLFSVWNGAAFFNSIFFETQMCLLFVFSPIMFYLIFNKNKRANPFINWFFKFLSISWILSCFFLSFFFFNVISTIVLSAFGVLIVVIGLFGLSKNDFSYVISRAISFLLLEIVLVSINKIICAVWLVPEGLYQPYAAMCLMIFDVIVPFLIMTFPPIHSILVGSFDSRWLLIEERCRFWLYRRQAKYEIRLMKATQRKPVLRNQK